MSRDDTPFFLAVDLPHCGSYRKEAEGADECGPGAWRLRRRKRGRAHRNEPRVKGGISVMAKKAKGGKKKGGKKR